MSNINSKQNKEEGQAPIIPKSSKPPKSVFVIILEGKARYAGQLIAPAEGFVLKQGFFCPS